MCLIFPQSKSTIFREFSRAMENTEIPPLENVLIVHYDEQFPKKGRTQKYRLTLLDANTKRPVADELFDKKDPETIKQFLVANLDTSAQSHNLVIFHFLRQTYPLNQLNTVFQSLMIF
jgi:hypothetical protein